MRHLLLLVTIYLGVLAALITHDYWDGWRVKAAFDEMLGRAPGGLPQRWVSDAHGSSVNCPGYLELYQQHPSTTVRDRLDRYCPGWLTAD